MSAKLTRVASGAVPSGTLTDWSRLEAMDDAMIDAAIAADPDSYALNDSDLTTAKTGVRYVVFESAGMWRWQLVADNGEILAESPRTYGDESAALKAIETLRTALFGSRLAA